MKVANWSNPAEIKELVCGNKVEATSCTQMSCFDLLYCPGFGCDVYEAPSDP